MTTDPDHHGAWARLKAWAHRHETVLKYAYEMVLLLIVVLLIQHNNSDARDRERNANAAAQYRECLQAQQGRVALRNVILVATTPQSGGVRFDLTKVPGFDALTPVEQDFFRNLSMNQGPGANPPPKIRPDGIPEPDPKNKLQVVLLATAPEITCSPPTG
jgi:hypothetical protein